MPKIIFSNSAPAAIGPYSQAVEANGMIFTSGQLGLDPATSELVAGGIKAQSEQSLKNLMAILAEAGITAQSVVKTTCFLADMDDFAAFNEVYAGFFPGKPARSCVAVKTLPKNALVEVEAIAAKD